jgi:hypothetical protein
MSGVFRYIYPPPSLTARRVCAFGAEGGHTRWVERGWGVNSSGDARHCCVLYICEYLVPVAFRNGNAIEFCCMYLYISLSASGANYWQNDRALLYLSLMVPSYNCETY